MRAGARSDGHLWCPDLNAALNVEAHTTMHNLPTAVVRDQLERSTLLNQMGDCARLMLQQHMPEHYVEIDSRVKAVESLLQSTNSPVVAVVGMGGIGMYQMSRIVVKLKRLNVQEVIC